jgi:uncharacterized membrane protein YgdD (TMEM256/DUF423 family)
MASDVIIKACLLAGGLLGAASVAAGAFGAHGLKAVLEASGQAANWDTAFRYALVHALALVACGLAAAVLPAGGGWPLAAAAGCFFVGTLVFSGFLAALALSGMRILGAIVPVGGVLLIAGWLLLAAAGLRSAGPHG